MDSELNTKTLITKRTDLSIDDKECRVINFTDISAYKMLEQQKETNKILKALNASVHHEMLAPLKCNVDLCKILIKKLQNQKQELQMVKVVLISSQMVMLHANDMLDQRIIEEGCFVPNYTVGSVPHAINEIIELISTTIETKEIIIEFA